MNFVKSKFSEIGEVIDIFCPNKRDKAGKRFGFVRFWEKQIRDPMLALERLNNIGIKSYKLQVFLPKYDRNQENKGTQRSNQNIVKGPTSFRVPEESYLKVASDGGKSKNGSTIGEERKIGCGDSLIFNTI